MNIVIFGCDNTGKSTLSQQLVDLLNEDIDYTAEMVHSLGPGKTYQEMVDFMKQNLIPKGSTHTKVFDRFPVIEETVYGPILRGHDKFFDVDISEFLDPVDLFIYCYPGLFTTLNWGEREQMDGVKGNVLEIINQYNKLAVWLKSQGYNVKEYNFKCDDYRRLLND